MCIRDSTNPTSQRTRNVLCIFRRIRYKILDTGTTTRNNIAELYSPVSYTHLDVYKRQVLNELYS